MQSVAQALHTFLQGLELTEKESRTASSQQETLRKNLREHLGGIERDILSGSYKRGTAIRPLHDIDLFLILEPTQHRGDSWNRRSPDTVLESVRAALARAYPNKDAARLQGRSVNIAFSGTGIGYDVVPAFREATEVYLIPDRARRTWISTNPEAHHRKLIESNVKAGSKLNPLIKAAKQWNVKAGKPIRSFHLEVMSYSAFSSPPATYAEGLEQLFRHLSVNVMYPCADPAALGPSVDEGISWNERSTAQTKFAEAVRSAEKANAASRSGRDEEAHFHWRELLGDAYPERGQPPRW